MEKLIVVQSDNKILHNNENEQTIMTHSNIDEFLKQSWMRADKQKRVHIMSERQNYFGVQREDCLTLVRGRD